MRVVIPIHRGRVSPLLDAARSGVLVEIRDGEPPMRSRIDLPGASSLSQVEAVLAAKPDAVVCGAISRRMLGDLLGRGLRVWPQVMAAVDEVVEALASKGSLGPEFRMPGFGGCGAREGRAGRPGREWVWGWHEAEVRRTSEEDRTMPKGDHTGPQGRGPKTGRGLGYCTGHDRPGWANPERRPEGKRRRRRRTEEGAG